MVLKKLLKAKSFNLVGKGVGTSGLIFVLLWALVLAPPEKAYAGRIGDLVRSFPICDFLLSRSSRNNSTSSVESEVTPGLELSPSSAPIDQLILNNEVISNKNIYEIYAEIIEDVSKGRDEINLSNSDELAAAIYFLEEVDIQYRPKPTHTNAHKKYLRKKLAHHFKEIQKRQRDLERQIRESKDASAAEIAAFDEESRPPEDAIGEEPESIQSIPSQVSKAEPQQDLVEAPSGEGLKFDELILKIEDGSPIAFFPNLIDIIQEFGKALKLPEQGEVITIGEALEAMIAERQAQATNLKFQVEQLGPEANQVNKAVSGIVTRYNKENVDSILRGREYKYIDKDQPYDLSNLDHLRVVKMTAARPRADGAELAVIAARSKVIAVNVEMQNLLGRTSFEFNYLPKGRQKHEKIAEVIQTHLEGSKNLSRYGLSQGSSFSDWAKRASDGEIDLIYKTENGEVWAEVKSAPVKEIEELEPILIQARRRFMFKDAFGLEAQDHIYFVKGIEESLAKILREMGYEVFGAQPRSAFSQ